jgi:hypothetical protein
VNNGPNQDDWFAAQDPELRGAPRAPSEETAGASADDWLSEADDPLRTFWVRLVDRRVVALGALLLVLLIAGLVAGGVFSGGGKGRPSPSSPTLTTRTTTTTGTTTAPPARHLPAPASTLKPGDTGSQVAVLQRALASVGFPSGKVDGQYGPATTKAVTRFQRLFGLTADGILGPATLRALVTALRGP